VNLLPLGATRRSSSLITEWARNSVVRVCVIARFARLVHLYARYWLTHQHNIVSTNTTLTDLERDQDHVHYVSKTTLSRYNSDIAIDFDIFRRKC